MPQAHKVTQLTPQQSIIAALDGRIQFELNPGLRPDGLQKVPGTQRQLEGSSSSIAKSLNSDAV